MDEPARDRAQGSALRSERGLTQRQLAEPAYTPAYISTLEAGRVRPSETALRFLAERLGPRTRSWPPAAPPTWPPSCGSP